MAKQNWITQKELSETLNVSKQVVQHWVKRGNIKSKLMFGVTVVDSNSIKMGKRGRPKQQGISG